MAKPAVRCTVGHDGQGCDGLKSLLAPWMAWALLQDGRAQLIDLRGRDEIDLPRIPGVRAIPLDELPSEPAKLDRERPVVFVSGTGRKAAEAMRVQPSAAIIACGVEGGVHAWLDAGLPTESGVVEAPAPPA
jgi:rhodanese-related sulfurtransferase